MSFMYIVKDMLGITVLDYVLYTSVMETGQWSEP